MEWRQGSEGARSGVTVGRSAFWARNGPWSRGYGLSLYGAKRQLRHLGDSVEVARAGQIQNVNANCCRVTHSIMRNCFAGLLPACPDVSHFPCHLYQVRRSSRQLNLKSGAITAEKALRAAPRGRSMRLTV